MLFRCSLPVTLSLSCLSLSTYFSLTVSLTAFLLYLTLFSSSFSFLSCQSDFPLGNTYQIDNDENETIYKSVPLKYRCKICQYRRNYQLPKGHLACGGYVDLGICQNTLCRRHSIDTRRKVLSWERGLEYQGIPDKLP
jgi:hypothetical protein